MALSDIWHTLAHRTGWIKSTAWLSVFFVLYAIALSSFYNIANNTAPEANFKEPKLKGGSTSDITRSPIFAGTLNIFMLALDPANNAISFAYNYTPSAAFLGTDPDDPDTAQELKDFVLFTFGPISIPQFDRGSETYGTQTRFLNPMSARGVFAFYPADEYQLSNVEVTCRFRNDTVAEGESVIITARTPAAVAPRCAFGLSLSSSIKNTFGLEVSDTRGSSTHSPADGVSYELQIKAARPVMFKLYPGFVIFALWLIILAELSLIFCLSFFEFRKAEFANVAAFSGLIFALPSFRNSMPLAPPFGSLCDWISFFWAESFAILGFVIMGAKYLIEQPPSKNSGRAWLSDVFCAPVPAKPSAVAPSETKASEAKAP